MMRLQRFAVFAFVSASLSLGIAPTGSAQDVEEEVTSAFEAWDAAFNSGDASAVASSYTMDALLLPVTHEVIEGPEGVEGFFNPLFEMGVSGHKLELIEAIDAGETIVGTAKWSATGKDESGADQSWGGLATTVFERQDDGSLKLKVHTFN